MLTTKYTHRKNNPELKSGQQQKGGHAEGKEESKSFDPNDVLTTNERRREMNAGPPVARCMVEIVFPLSALNPEYLSAPQESLLRRPLPES